MRLGRGTKINNQPKPVELGWQGHVIAENHRRLRAEYAKGLQDGVAMTLDHIMGKAAGGQPYIGPLPDELRVYVGQARAQIDALRQEEPS